MLGTEDSEYMPKTPAKKGVTLTIGARKGALKDIGGSQSDHWNNVLLNQAISTLWTAHSDDETLARQRNATVEALMGIGPKDELEGMLAAQLIAAHNAAMECYRRAMLREQTFEGRQQSLSQGSKLSRTSAALVEALNRHRGKGQQKVTVEHVHVHSGGQAVVGMVAPTAALPSSEQSNAKRVAHAPQPALRSEDPKREAMPIPSDAERPVQDARRGVSRGSEGQ
jgi:hypothetical protein